MKQLKQTSNKRQSETRMNQTTDIFQSIIDSPEVACVVLSSRGENPNTEHCSRTFSSSLTVLVLPPLICSRNVGIDVAGGPGVLLPRGTGFQVSSSMLGSPVFAQRIQWFLMSECQPNHHLLTVPSSQPLLFCPAHPSANSWKVLKTMGTSAPWLSQVVSFISATSFKPVKIIGSIEDK